MVSLELTLLIELCLHNLKDQLSHSCLALPLVQCFFFFLYRCPELGIAALSISKSWKGHYYNRSLWNTLSSFAVTEHAEHSQRALLAVPRNVISGTIMSGTGFSWCNPRLSMCNSTFVQIDLQRKEKLWHLSHSFVFVTLSWHQSFPHGWPISVFLFSESIIFIIRWVPSPRVNGWARVCEVARLRSP